MTVFEIVFGLVSVILGLALTQMVGNLHELALARRRVRWALEPLLLAILIFMIICQVWLDQWNEHDERGITVGVLMLQVLKMLAIFFAAASVLPNVPQDDEPIDLGTFYYRTRLLPYAAMIIGLLLFFAYGFIMYPHPVRIVDLAIFMSVPALYASLIVIRWRPYHIATLLLVIGTFGTQIVGRRIGT